MKVFYVLICLHSSIIAFGSQITEKDISLYRQRVTGMFYHAYDGYIKYAYPYDELRPLSCDGVDTWGSFSLTLIDALDTLAVMGNFTEFRRVAQLLVDKAQFDMNINVSVFETNIRVIGGLLSAHLLSHRAGMDLEPGWPCSGPLLRLAETVGRKLLPAFETYTGMPFGTVNLRYGVPRGETPVTCTAGVTTFIVEFGTLSRLTGDPIFEDTALRALLAMWEARSSIGLVGNHIDVQTSKWTALDSGIGAGVDSYYEYLVKGSILLQKPELMEMFQEFREAIDNHMLRDDWYMWVNMMRGHVTMPLFQSLEAYWPGLLSLVGDIESALKSLHNYHQVWKQYGFTPEFYNIQSAESNNGREGYPLRPELIESIMYLYRATEDPSLLQMGVDILESIQHSTKTRCGYATVKDVRDHKIEDRMESFFLAETTKYLYLLFDPTNFIHDNGSRGTLINTLHGKCVIGTGGYIFNTEAHPVDIAAVHCCSAQKKAEDAIIKHFESTLDLSSFYGLTADDSLKVFRRTYRPLKKKSKATDYHKLRKNCPGTKHKGSKTGKAVPTANSEPANRVSEGTKAGNDKSKGSKCKDSIVKIDGTVVSKICQPATDNVPKKAKIDSPNDKKDENIGVKSPPKNAESKTEELVDTENSKNIDNKNAEQSADKTISCNSDKSAENKQARSCENRGPGFGAKPDISYWNVNAKIESAHIKYASDVPVLKDNDKTQASNVNSESTSSKPADLKPSQETNTDDLKVKKPVAMDEVAPRTNVIPKPSSDASDKVINSADESSSNNDDMVKTHGLVSSMDRDDDSDETKNRILVKTYSGDGKDSPGANSASSDVSAKTEKMDSDHKPSDISKKQTSPPSLSTSIHDSNVVNAASGLQPEINSDVKETHIPTETASQPDKEKYSSPSLADMNNMTSSEYQKLLGITIPKPRRIVWSKYGFTGDYDILTCPAQPFLQRLSLMGEMFNVK